MPASAQASHKHNSLDIALNGGSRAYSPVMSTTHHPHVYQHRERNQIQYYQCEYCQDIQMTRPPHAVPCPERPSATPLLLGELPDVQPIETSAQTRPAPAPTDRSETIPQAQMDAELAWTLTPLEERFRHGFWSARRHRTYAALQDAEVSPRRLVNFAQCGSGARVMVNDETGQVRTQATYCHDRFCEACQRARTFKLAAALRSRIGQAKCLHVVLTLKSHDGPLAPQLDRIYAASRKLRASKLWRRCVTGGSQTLEVTRNKETGQWHPHLHLLVHSEWLPQDKLSAAWLKATGDSHIVHVSLVERTEAAAREVTKYLGKPIHRSIDFDQAALVETILALKSRRLINAFGTWRSDPLLTDDAPDDAGTWKFVCTLDHLHVMASRGDAWARAALLYLTSLMPGRTPHPAPPRRDGS